MGLDYDNLNDQGSDTLTLTLVLFILLVSYLLTIFDDPYN